MPARSLCSATPGSLEIRGASTKRGTHFSTLLDRRWRCNSFLSAPRACTEEIVSQGVVYDLAGLVG
jgi:hypothetical protein